MYKFYSACPPGSNRAVMEEWESINYYETLQFEKDKKKYPEYFNYSFQKNESTNFDEDLIRENDKLRLRLSRQEVEELLDLENGISYKYMGNNQSKTWEDFKYFKPISSSIQKKIIPEKIGHKIIVKPPILVNEITIPKPVKPKLETVFDSENLKKVERAINEIKVRQKCNESSFIDKIKSKSQIFKESSESLSSESIEDTKKTSLNDIFLNFFLMNSFLTLDKNGCLTITQDESYQLFRKINKALKLGKSKQEIRDFIDSFDRDDQNFICFNSFENAIVNSLLHGEKYDDKCYKEKPSTIIELNENEELNNLNLKKDNRSIGYKIAFVNLFLANSLASLDMRSEYRISKNGAFDVLLTLNKLMGKKFSESALQKLVDSFDSKNDNYIDLSEFKKSVVRMITKQKETN